MTKIEEMWNVVSVDAVSPSDLLALAQAAKACGEASEFDARASIGNLIVRLVEGEEE